MDEVVLDADGSECEIVEAAAVPRRKRCRTAKLTVDMVDKVHKPWLIAVFSSEEPCLSDACLALVQQRLAQDMQPRVGQVCMGFLVASWRILPYSQLDTSEAQAMLGVIGWKVIVWMQCGSIGYTWDAVNNAIIALGNAMIALVIGVQMPLTV